MNGRQPDSEFDPAHDCAFARENLEALALDALDAFERGIVEQHLRWCPSCRDEATSYERVAGLLPFAGEPGPPPSAAVKARLFARIGNVDNDSAPSAMPVPRTLAGTASSQSAGWMRSISTAIVAPLALALLVMGVWANALHNDLEQRETQLANQAIISTSLESSGQVQLYAVERTCPTCDGNGQLGVSPSNGMGMMVGQNFDPGQQHDVWQVNETGEKKKVCQLQVDADGAVMQMFTFPEELSVYTDVQITDGRGSLIYTSHLAGPGEDAEPTPASA